MNLGTAPPGDSPSPASPRHRRWLLALGGVAAAGVGAWLLAVGQPVRTATVLHPPARVVVVAPAHARLRERYVVSAPLDGAIEPVALRPGAPVRAGQAVAWLRPAASALAAQAQRGDAQATLAQATHEWRTARDEVAGAEAERTRVRAQAQRAEVLYAQQLVAREQVESGHARVMSSDAALRVAQARLDAAQARMAAARAVLDLQHAGGAGRLALEAPIDGVVLGVPHAVGGLVRAGQALLEIGEPSAVEVVAELRSSEGWRVDPGTVMRLRRPGVGGELLARVRRIEPGTLSRRSPQGLAESRVAVLADLETVDAARLTPGRDARLEVRVAVPSAPELLAVPTSALFVDGGRWSAFVVARGRARLRRVDPGVVGDAISTVRAGLALGDAVVVDPPAALRDGDWVRRRR